MSLMKKMARLIQQDLKRKAQVEPMNIGDKFMLTDEAIENYGEQYRDKVFTVSEVSLNSDDHPGYDSAADGEALYDAEELNFSVYEYEVIRS